MLPLPLRLTARTRTQTGPLDRWAVEVRDCDMHHNTLGFSGTAGNSVYVHDNRIRSNGIGFVVESILGGHPGMPGARWRACAAARCAGAAE